MGASFDETRWDTHTYNNAYHRDLTFPSFPRFAVTLALALALALVHTHPRSFPFYTHLHIHIRRA